MRKFLSWLHTYGGLLFFPLLLIFGLSALHINHSLGFFVPHVEWTESKKTISLHDTTDNQILAESIRDSLGLMGWCPYWTQNRNENRFRFDITHNGAEYKIDAGLETGLIKIKRRSKGFGNVLNSLHFFNENLPSGTHLVNSWQHYKNLCFIYIIIAIISGIYLFIRKKSSLATGFIIIISMLSFSAFLLLYVWLIG